MIDWFTTIPGILVICGVILLVIAIILFILGAKKSKKEGVADSESMVQTPVESAPVIKTVNTQPTPVDPVTVDTVNPSVDITTVSTDAPITIEESVQINEPEKVEVETPEITIEEPVVETQIMDIPTVSEVPTVEENNSTIYGGEVPTVNLSVNEEKPVTIYGGNDPLEATQALPKLDEHHEPYGGVYPEARIVDPIQSVEIPKPVEEVVSAMPTSTLEPSIAPTIQSIEPVVEAIPTLENTSFVIDEPTPIIIPSQEELKPVVEEL